MMLKLAYLCATAIIMISFSRTAAAQNPPQIPYQSPGVGNTTYKNNGTISQTHGNQTYTYGPNGHTIVCSTYGTQTVCK